MTRPEPVEPGVLRVLAPNPSPMTAEGTNTYLLGTSEVTVIDPGPADAAHLRAILAACAGRPVARILVTHAHLDHSPLAGPLSRETGAPVLAYGDAGAGRSPVMQGLGRIGGGEGVDAGFVPDEMLKDGAMIETADGPIRALWTPGHFGNHMAFLWRDMGFVGDLVMGWASSLVSPPDGDLTQFMASCRRLRSEPLRVLHSGHGAPVGDPAARIDWLIAHRESREAEILHCLGQKAGDAADLARRIYVDTPAALLPAASRNVLAHLIDLETRSLVQVSRPMGIESTFHRA